MAINLDAVKAAAYLLEKTAASRLRRETTLVPLHSPDGTLYRMHVAGVPVGEMAVDASKNVVGSGLYDRYQGLGLGKKLYGDVIRNEGRLSADVTSVSNAANRVWEGMGKRPGYALTRNPGYAPSGRTGKVDPAWNYADPEVIQAHGRGPWTATLPNARGPAPSIK